ncbi:PIN domain-containing protein [Candidatus Woesearchaeota archaeon]|nr:PIN domain-containing protein [Candidatus Woesearchaeota archaeon]
MSIRYVLDTSAWIEYFLATDKKIQEIVSNNELGTPIMVIAELSDKYARDKADFSDSFDFIKTKSRILRLSLNSYSNAGSLKNIQRKTHPSFGLADALIYLTAKENNAILVTKDNDFKDMDNVMLLE